MRLGPIGMPLQLFQAGFKRFVQFAGGDFFQHAVIENNSFFPARSVAFGAEIGDALTQSLDFLGRKAAFTGVEAEQGLHLAVFPGEFLGDGGRPVLPDFILGERGRNVIRRRGNQVFELANVRFGQGQGRLPLVGDVRILFALDFILG